MTANERLLRKALRTLLNALDVYHENRVFGIDDDDLDDDGCSKTGRRVDAAFGNARAALHDTNPRGVRVRKATVASPSVAKQ